MIDPLIRHQSYLQRYASGQVKETEKLLEQMLADVKARLMVGGDTVFQEARLSVLERDITAILTAYGQELDGAIKTTTAELVPNEIKFYDKTLAGAVSVSVSGVSFEQVVAAVNDDILVLLSGKKATAATPTELVEIFTTTANRDIIHAVRSGIVDGSTTGQITKTVNDLVDTRTRQQSEALVRTLINNASSKSSAAVYDANKDLLEGEQWVAVLDGRTTYICASRDGKMFKVGEPPYPPAHYNCRSIRVPIVKEKYRIGELDQRASIYGPVSADLTYSDWLKTQPATFQNDMLGAKRAELFRNGEITLDKLVDDRGLVLTLDELAVIN